MTAKKELNQNKFLMGGESILDLWFSVCLKWYIRKACFYKRLYYTMTLTSIISPILSASLASMNVSGSEGSWIKYIPGVLALAASISVAILTTLRAQEKWGRYRMVAEQMKKSRMRYLQELESDKTNEEIKKRFLNEIEQLMKEENLEWMKLNQADEEGKQDKKS